MKGSSAGPVNDDWIRTKAIIVACKQLLLGRESLSSAGYLPPEYIVTFSYSVDGQIFEGTYRANSQQECGHGFEVLYDPKKPSRNTGADVLDKRWVRFTAAALGVIAVLVAILFSENEDWFRW